VLVDKEARTLTLRDNGIGMSEEEAIAHLGTIAKSGTRDFMAALGADKKADANLIGQFGVGFYSGYIVADRITVESAPRRLAGGAGRALEQRGHGRVRGRDHRQGRPRHRRDPAPARGRGRVPAGLEAAFHHQQVQRPHQPAHPDAQEGKLGRREVRVPGDRRVGNGQQGGALWTRAKSEITAEQYQEFYKRSATTRTAPLAYTHNRVEGRSEYTQLLYIPAKAPFDLWNRDKKPGVKLYVKRVFIMDDAQALLPAYLRFVRA
jgi:molecular chaperone HtpG